MGLADALKTGPGRDSRRRCGTAEWIKSLPEEEKAAAHAMLDSSEWRTQDIYRAFCAEGYEQSPSPLQKHRSGDCACVAS